MGLFRRKKKNENAEINTNKTEVPILINVYCTHRNPPSLSFPHELNSRRDRMDLELSEHLNGFVGYILKAKNDEMTQTLYHVMRHIERVQHHLSINILETNLGAFEQWGWAANALCFLPDGTVRDPSGHILVDPTGNKPEDAKAEIPYPQDAHDRKNRTTKQLQQLDIKVPRTLPPVISEVEVDMRLATDVAKRALALFIVAVRAESLATKDEIKISELKNRAPLAFDALSQKESDFLLNSSPAQDEIINFSWRYEALNLLLWALGFLDDLALPTKICDVPKIARIMINKRNEDFISNAHLRSNLEILDALDLHYRLHWAARQANLDKKDVPANLNIGVIKERHYALNWLIRFEDNDWDEVDTPT